MPKFTLGCEVTVSAYTTVEADTLEQAIALADDRQMVTGGIGSGADEDEQWIVDEIDGAPQNIHEVGSVAAAPSIQDGIDALKAQRGKL